MRREPLKLGDKVKLTPNGPIGAISGFPRKFDGEPPLAHVRWPNGNVGRHDVRILIRVDEGSNE